VFGERGVGPLAALPLLLGLLVIVGGVLEFGSNPGYGLVAIGVGFGLIGVGGSLYVRGLGLLVSGTAAFVLIVIGVILEISPRF